MKTKRLCIRCGAMVKRETEKTIDYPFYCPGCDENMYRFETIPLRQLKRNKKKLEK